MLHGRECRLHFQASLLERRVRDLQFGLDLLVGLTRCDIRGDQLLFAIEPPLRILDEQTGAQDARQFFDIKVVVRRLRGTELGQLLLDRTLRLIDRQPIVGRVQFQKCRSRVDAITHFTSNREHSPFDLGGHDEFFKTKQRADDRDLALHRSRLDRRHSDSSRSSFLGCSTLLGGIFFRGRPMASHEDQQTTRVQEPNGEHTTNRTNHFAAPAGAASNPRNKMSSTSSHWLASDFFRPAK